MLCPHLPAVPLRTLRPFSRVSLGLPEGALSGISFSTQMPFVVCVDDGGVETESQHVAHASLKPSTNF